MWRFFHIMPNITETKGKKMNKILYAGFVSGLIKTHNANNHSDNNVATNAGKTDGTSTLAAQRVVAQAIAIRQGITPSSYDLRR